MDIIKEILLAIVTVCVPILSTYGVKLIKRLADKATAETDSALIQGYIEEIAEAISTAVSNTNQTYVDSLKAAGAFTAEAQKEALQKSLTTAAAILSTEAAEFIEEVYGDVTAYLTVRIEAEVREQKLSTGVAVTSTLESTADTTTVAATTAAATAATIAQTAVSQLAAEASVTSAEPEETPEPEE